MRKRHRLLILAVSMLVALVVIGTIFFMSAENWTFVDSLYFTAMTVTTIGYGDLVPSHDISKIVATIYAVLSIPIALFAFGIIAENYFEIRLAGLERRMIDIVSRERDIKKAVDENNKKKEKEDEK